MGKSATGYALRGLPHAIKAFRLRQNHNESATLIDTDLTQAAAVPE